MINYTGLLFLVFFFSLLYFIKEKYNDYIINNYSFLVDYTKEEEIIEELKSNSANDIMIFILKRIKKWGAISLNNNVYKLNENTFFSFLLKKYIILFYSKNLNSNKLFNDIKIEIYKLNKINNINNILNSIKIDENIEIVSNEKQNIFLKKEKNFYLLKLILEEKNFILIYKNDTEIIKIKKFNELKNILDNYI